MDAETGFSNSDIITIIFGVLGSVVSLVSVIIAYKTIKLSKADSTFRTLNEILAIVENDLKKIKLVYYIQNQPPIEEIIHANGFEEPRKFENFQQMHVIFPQAFHYHPKYKEHLDKKVSLRVYEEDIWRIIIQYQALILNQQASSYREIKNVIIEAETSGMSMLLKKFLYRKIHRMCSTYYLVLNSTINRKKMNLTQEYNDITNYYYDVPYYNEKRTDKGTRLYKTTLFKEFDYDELFLTMKQYNVYNLGKRIV